MAKSIKISATKINSDTFDTAVERWINPDYIIDMKVAGANGAYLRYADPTRPTETEYTTTTAASAIATLANA